MVIGLVNIVLVEKSGNAVELEVEEGKSIMEAAVENMVVGIEAECGGFATCGTCHVKVVSDHLDKLEPPSNFEDMLLSGLANSEEGSRLSCQIPVSSELEGLTLKVMTDGV